MKKVLGFLLIVAVVLVLIFTGSKKEVFEPELVLADGEEQVVLSESQDNKDEVVVSYAKLTKPGYLVVVERDENDKKLIVALSKLLVAGEHTDVVLDVDQKTKRRGNGGGNNSTRTVAMVYDDGDETLTDADALVVVDLETEEIFGEEVVLEEESEDVAEEATEEGVEDGYLILEDGTAIVADVQLEGLEEESEETAEEVADESEETTEGESEEETVEEGEEGSETGEETAEEVADESEETTEGETTEEGATEEVVEGETTE